MRVVDILCVVVVTKLFVTSNASSTPADYSTHSLISGDTPDAVRALRVGDESDIQEERTLPFVEHVLRYIPGTAANHGAAKVANVAEIAEAAKVAEIAEAAKVAEIDEAAEVTRVENLLDVELLSDTERRSYIRKLPTSKSKWDEIKRLLGHKVEPKYVSLLFSKNGKDKKRMMSFLDPYTKLYTKLDSKKSKEAFDPTAINEAVQSFQAQRTVGIAIDIPTDGIKGWLESLSNADTEWKQFQTMVLKGVVPDDLRMTLQWNDMKESKVDSLVNIYSIMYHAYHQFDDPLKKASLVQVADDIVATAPRNQG